MEVISAREFRANQEKYFAKAANGEDIIVNSRGLGSFRLMLITSEDRVLNEEELQARIESARAEIKEGNCTRVKDKEELTAYLETL